jgi:hypothetical protein
MPNVAGAAVRLAHGWRRSVATRRIRPFSVEFFVSNQALGGAPTHETRALRGSNSGTIAGQSGTV